MYLRLGSLKRLLEGVLTLLVEIIRPISQSPNASIFGVFFWSCGASAESSGKIDM